MKKIFRAGIVGCGKIASDYADDPMMRGDIFTHAEAYTECKDTILSAICDINPTRLQLCGDRWKVQARYENIKEMVEKEELDILSVSTPDSTHYQVIKNVLSCTNSIKVILCEKPLAMNVLEAEELVREAKENGLILVVMYMRRFARNYQGLKEFISEDNIGKIQSITGWYTKGVRHNGTHWFDVLRFFGEEAEWVMAWNNLDDDPIDPTLDVVLGTRNGFIVSLRACDSEVFTVFEMDIMGTKGRVRILDSGFQMEFSKVVDSRRYSGYKELEISPQNFGDRKNLMLHAIENIVQALKFDTSVLCSGQDGVETLRISEAALKSAKTGMTVRIT
jgi:predicted dehydrogenase